MEPVIDPDGRCPSCEGPGPVAAPCATPRCQRRGYHFVPSEWFAAIDHTGLVDPVLGQMRGDYLVVGVLGSGGLGKVYHALQWPIALPAALKLLGNGHEPPDPHAVERFRGEAMALARLTHPNIVRLLKFGVHDGVPYLVMEYVEGSRTLRDLQRRRELDPESALRVLLQILSALEDAHARNIIHRDIKPPNVMVQAVPGEPFFVRLVDFGLAKFTEDGDDTRQLAGTPSYMAPEQLDRTNIGPWTDLYAVAVIAFELMTRRRPFPGTSSEDVLRLKRQADYSPLDQVADLDLPRPARAFFERALAPNPADRYADAADFRAALQGAFGSANATAAWTIPPDMLEAAIAEAEADDPPEPTSLQMRGESFTATSRRPTRRRGALFAAFAAAALGVIALGLLLRPTPPDAPPEAPAPSLAAAAPAVDAAAVADAPDASAAADAGAPDAALPAYDRALSRARAGDRAGAADALQAALEGADDAEAMARRAKAEADLQPIVGATPALRALLAEAAPDAEKPPPRVEKQPARPPPAVRKAPRRARPAREPRPAPPVLDLKRL